MENVNFDELKQLVKEGKVVWREHALQRMRERNILRDSVKEGIFSGEIIERYPEDYPVPSCLILGYTEQVTPIHVVCSVFEGMACIITTYIPNKDKWEDDFKTRKVVM